MIFCAVNANTTKRNTVLLASGLDGPIKGNKQRTVFDLVGKLKERHNTSFSAQHDNDVNLSGQNKFDLCGPCVCEGC